MPGVFIFSNLFPSLTKIWTYINYAYTAHNSNFGSEQVIVNIEEVYTFFSILFMKIY